MIEAATILAAISPAQEARFAEIGFKLAQLVPLFGATAYTSSLIFLAKNAWGVFAVGVFLLFFPLYPFELPGDDSKYKINVKVRSVRTNIRGNPRTVIAATGVLVTAFALIMIFKTMWW